MKRKERIAFHDNLSADQVQEVINSIWQLTDVFPDNMIHLTKNDRNSDQIKASSNLIPINGQQLSNQSIFNLPITLCIGTEILIYVGTKFNICVKLTDLSDEEWNIYSQTIKEVIQDKEVRRLLLPVKRYVCKKKCHKET